MSVEQYVIGVDLGGTNIKCGLVSKNGNIIIKEEIRSNAGKGPDAVVKQILKGIKLVMKENRDKVIGVGIGSPGVVIHKSGSVENPPNFPGWKKVSLAKLITKEIQKEVHLENDANAAAIGELIFGAGKSLRNFIMVTLGTGVGGGLIIDGKIYHGENGAAGEIGHVSIDGNGPKCNCGSFGCIEAYVGNQYLINRVKGELQIKRNSLIHNLLAVKGTELSPKLIHEAAQLGDPYAKSVIKEVGSNIGIALASIVNLLDVTNVVIGGGVSGFGIPMFNATSKMLKERVLTSLKSKVKVVPAKLKNEAGILGASALVFYNS